MYFIIEKVNPLKLKTKNKLSSLFKIVIVYNRLNL